VVGIEIWHTPFDRGHQLLYGTLSNAFITPVSREILTLEGVTGGCEASRSLGGNCELIPRDEFLSVFNAQTLIRKPVHGSTIVRP